MTFLFFAWSYVNDCWCTPLRCKQKHISAPLLVVTGKETITNNEFPFPSVDLIQFWNRSEEMIRITATSHITFVTDLTMHRHRSEREDER